MSVNVHLQKVKEVFINNGEYDFDNEQDAERYAKKLLWRIESLYQEEDFYRDYEDLSDFIISHYAGSEVY
ncbi:hypothetical protein [Bacillus sp. NPDC094106]|uniref:hypothetical protein n=1 Tax=Bacillus sp. NPDC094106 TaxID=3363949 RepID=UPI0037FA9849